MPASAASPITTGLSLEMTWTPATETERCRYQMTLVNDGPETLERFSLAFSGPGRVDEKLPMEGGIILKRLSNFTEVAMEGSGVLAPGSSWTFAFRGIASTPFRHWSDVARMAYVTLGNGRRRAVKVGHCVHTGIGPGTPKLDYETLGNLADIADGIAVVPRPATVRVSGSRAVASLAPMPDLPESFTAVAAFTSIAAVLFPGERFIGTGLPVHFARAALADEAYSIRFGGEVTISASGQNGFLYGLITLGQILRAARMAPDACRFPAEGEIIDAPRFPWRGGHIDLARQWYGYDELTEFTAILAWNKLNRLHLHLTEDEAWRFEVEAYPQLVETGAFRGAGEKLPPLLGSPMERHGGFYTRRQLKDLVILARSYGIECIPEVDVPGHCYAAIQALPELRDPGENVEYRSIQGFPNNCLNSAVPATNDFAAKVFEELMEIFPGKWIHVGADEVPDDAWAGSPLAKARLAEIGGGVHEMQADFLRNLHDQIRAAGRVTGAWEEGAHGGGISADGSYLVAWRNAEIGAELASKGYDVVMSPGQAYYLDMARSTDWWEPGASWAGVSSLENTYRFDPLEGYAPEYRHKMIGVQACIWSESMFDRRIFQRLVFPRLSAIAETGWTAEENRDYARFAAATRFLPVMYGDA